MLSMWPASYQEICVRQPQHFAQHLAHFAFGEQGWQVLGAFGAQGVDWGSSFNFQYIAIAEKKGIESLVLG